MADPTHTPRDPGQLVGVVAVSEILGVTRQRASVLVNRPDFPAPVEPPPELAGATLGRLWRRGDVEAWDAKRTKKPGPAAHTTTGSTTP